MAETVSLHVVVRYFNHQLRPQRLPRKVFALAPAALSAGHAFGLFVASMIRPMFPGMRSQRIFTVGREEIHKFLALGRTEACTYPNVL